MRDALRQVKPTEFEDLIALVALYRPGPMQYIPSYAARKNGREAITYHRRAAARDHERLAGICVYQEQYLLIAKHDGRLHGRRSGDAASRDRQEDPRADGVAEGEVPQRLRREQRHAVRREPALEGHGVVTGLLLQQGPLGLLRADRLPHRLAEGELPVRVHGGADLVGDEHEGPGADLRQRLRRDGDQGAAAGRERVGDGFRGRRRQDPLRAQRGQERRRQRRARDHRGAQGRRAVRDDLGLHRARRPAGREQACARVARQVRRARLDRGLADGDARGARAGARLRAEARRRPARRPGVDLRPRLRRRRARGGRGAQAPSSDRRERVREGRAAAAREGDARPLRLGAPAQRRARPAAPQDRRDARRARAPARRRGRRRSAGSSRRSST